MQNSFHNVVSQKTIYDIPRAPLPFPPDKKTTAPSPENPKRRLGSREPATKSMISGFPEKMRKVANLGTNNSGEEKLRVLF